jgi:hypothetical protein
MVKRRCSHVHATAQKGKGSAKINTDDEVLPASSYLSTRQPPGATRPLTSSTLSPHCKIYGVDGIGHTSSSIGSSLQGCRVCVKQLSVLIRKG